MLNVHQSLMSPSYLQAPSSPTPVPYLERSAPLDLDPYPVDALGQQLGAAVQEHHCNTQVSTGLIGPIALGAAGLLVSDLFDVERPNCAPSPTNVNVCVITSTNEGKDTAAEPFLKPIKEHQHKLDNKIKMDAAAAKAKHYCWKAELLCIQKAIQELIAQNMDHGSEIDRLTAHFEKEPRAMQAPDIIISEITRAALTKSLSRASRSVAIYTVEASSFFNGRSASADMPFWNELWGGSSIYVETAELGRMTVQDPRVSLIFGIQPEPFKRFLMRRGTEAHDAGLTARFLWSMPSSTNGYRSLSGAPFQTGALSRCAARFSAMLDEGLQRREHGGPRPAIAFSPGAAKYFKAIYDQYQKDMRFGNRYAEIRGYAGKAPEMAGRVAAILHAVDGKSGPLSEESLDRAASIVKWHANQFLAMIYTYSDRARLLQDAKEIIQYMQGVQRMGGTGLETRHLKDLIPGDMSTRRFNKALTSLLADGQLVLARHARREFVMIAPPFNGALSSAYAPLLG